MDSEKNILYDSVKSIISNGFFSGSIISKCRDPFNSIIFSDNLTVLEEQKIEIKEGLRIGFEPYLKKKIAFSRKNDQLVHALVTRNHARCILFNHPVYRCRREMRSQDLQEREAVNNVADGA